MITTAEKILLKLSLRLKKLYHVKNFGKKEKLWTKIINISIINNTLHVHQINKTPSNNKLFYFINCIRFSNKSVKSILSKVHQ
jgi:hypothetical protein